MVGDMSGSAEEEEEEEEEDGKKEKAKETVWEWELLNDAKPIWLRSPSDVSEEEYTKFYHAISKVTIRCLGKCMAEVLSKMNIQQVDVIAL